MLSLTAPAAQAAVFDVPKPQTALVAPYTPQGEALPPERDPEAMIAVAASKWGISYEELYETLRCESAGFQNIQSLIPDPTGPDGREDSWGWAQIHLPSHPEVTKEEALDPAWAVEWTAEEFASGRAWMWSCWKARPLSR